MRRLHYLFPLSVLMVGSQLSGCQPTVDSNNVSVPEQQEAAQASADFAAHWLDKNLLILTKHNAASNYSLVTKTATGIEKKVLSPIAFPVWAKTKYPHLASGQAYRLEIQEERGKQWLKQPLYVVENTAPHHKSYVQTGEVIDAYYTQGTNDADEVADLGVTIKGETASFKLWAPTATTLSVQLHQQDKQPLPKGKIALVFDPITGIWSGSIDQNAVGQPLTQLFYQYHIEVYHPASEKVEQIVTTDPYSLSLSTNSEYSQIVDLDAPYTQPNNWTERHDVPLNKPEDAVLYEVHIRDFSAMDTKLSDETYRGKFKAFTEQKSEGMQYIKSLKQAGLNHIHLLPAFDIGTVDEEKGKAIDLTSTVEHICQVAPTVSVCHQEFDNKLTLSEILDAYDPKSSNAQALVTELKTFDKYNWGYDPFHYTVPEGSYATNADGVTRIVEFREMVQSLHKLGFRVVMDVVYNHTHQARLERTAVLDKIVPNYYQRLHPITGDIEQSTCCDNTATERVMMAKLMTDSLVVWAKDYRVDGFRFDLMGHQPKQLMLNAREAVRAVDSDTYFYGEGWNFGEVANNRQFVQASQIELAGTEIGTFTDRLRDAVRGPGISVQGDDIRRNQGIGNGLLTKPNELNIKDPTKAPNYYVLMDHVRLGLAGNLANYPLIDHTGKKVLGKDIPYGNQPAGYALDPADTINYISKHDNQTLWDNNQYRNATDLTTEERVRLHNQSLSFALLAQGIPFLHMGSELLRSKSYLRDSYDYSDWFNRVDFSMQTNFYSVGLPPAEKDEANWPLISALLDHNQGRDYVTEKDIKFAANVFKEFLTIRTSTPLFSLATGEEIIEQVRFLNTGEAQQIGLIAMHIKMNEQPKGQQFTEIVVLFNTAPDTQIFNSALAAGFELHPVQQQGVDETTKESKAMANGFSIPAFTTAVFVKPKS